MNIAILSTLATHAAVAINNAKAFEQARRAYEKADHARLELERHARDVQRAAAAHEQLTSLLAKGAPLSTLTSTVAGLLNGSVLVLDEAFQVISQACSTEYAGMAAQAYKPHTASNSRITHAIQASRQGGRSIIAYEEDGEICRVAAVIGGNDVLGAVLLFRHTDLDEISVRTLERSATVMAIVLLSQERMEATKNRDASAFLRSLVTAHLEERVQILERAKRLGLDLSQPFSLMLIETEHPKPDAVARRLRAGSLLSELVIDEIDGTLAIICPTTKAQDTVKEFTAIAKREFGGGFCGILSRPIRALDAIPTLYLSMRRGLSIVHRLGINGQIIDQSQMALYSVLFESHDQESLKAFIDSSVGPVIAHDLKRGTRIADTLLKYLDNNQNAKSTAANLGIHVNTVRQRLANVDELLGHWSGANRALEIHVALRLWRLSVRKTLQHQDTQT